MKGAASAGEDFDPRAITTRLTNLDFLRPGSTSWAMVQTAVRAVNTRIAPAEINERSFIVRDDIRAIEFRGRWGTFRVSFLVSERLLDMGLLSAGGHQHLMYELEGLMSTAINNALGDLVRTEMRAELVRVEGAQEREWRKIEREYAALAERVAKIEVPWWRRLADAWNRITASPFAVSAASAGPRDPNAA